MLALLLLVLLACQPGGQHVIEDEPDTIMIDEGAPRPAVEPEPPAEPSAEAPPTPEHHDDDPGASDPAPATVAPPPEGDAPGETLDTPAVRADQIPDDHGPLGGACRAYLRGDVPSLGIEVMHQAGSALRADAVDHLLTALGDVLDKPGGIELVGPRQVPGQGRTWSPEDLRAFLAEHRGERSGDQRMTMAVLAVGGEFEQQGVLGVALNATEIVLFPDEIGGLGTSLLGGRTAIERAVLLHEAGHLLCLVNIGYRSELDHEDPQRPHHSRHRDSVMFWAVPNDAITQVFAGPPPDTFHEDDLADLQALRDGRY